MVRHTKSRKRLFRKHTTSLRESSSEDELCSYFSGAYKAPTNTLPETLTDQNDDDLIEHSHEAGIVLSTEQMDNLKVSQYEYNAAAGSVLEKLFVQRFWCWLTGYVPLSIMPCTITAIGFALNLVTSSILIYYSPGADQTVPAWSLYLAAAGVFLYQTADALDGKQCYKMQNSQIEEFYDHACDSVSTILLMYSIAISTNCGLYPTLLILLIHCSLVAFWSTHWQCYITNQMIFGNIDVTEAQFVMIFTHLCSAVFGQQIWSTVVCLGWGMSAHANQLLALATLLTLFRSIWLNCRIAVFGGRTPLEIVGALPFKRRSDTVRPLVPIVLLTLLLNVNWCLLPQLLTPQQQQQQQPDEQQVGEGEQRAIENVFTLVTFVAIFGTSTAKLTMRLVLAHCTSDDAPLLDSALLAPVMLLLTVMTPIRVYLNAIMLLTLIVNCVMLGHFFIGVGIDMEKALDIKIFTLKYPVNHPKNRTSHKGIYINGLNNAQILNKQSL